MALELPSTAEEIDNKAKTDVQRELGGSNPFARNHWLGALIYLIVRRPKRIEEQGR